MGTYVGSPPSVSRTLCFAKLASIFFATDSSVLGDFMDLQRSSHLRGDVCLVKVSAEHRRDVRGRESDGGCDVVVIAKNAIRRIEADPARAGQVRLGPRVQRAFRAWLGLAELTQVSAREPGRD